MGACHTALAPHMVDGHVLAAEDEFIGYLSCLGFPDAPFKPFGNRVDVLDDPTPVGVAFRNATETVGAPLKAVRHGLVWFGCHLPRTRMPSWVPGFSVWPLAFDFRNVAIWPRWTNGSALPE